ncbi:MAG: MBG domain-containing protein [Eubacteriales bacterium]|nr:MBG domain-containing protein [Eubacteriales bacterium]
MSKKGLKTMLVCIVLLIGLVTLFACNKSDVADKDGQTKVIVKIQDEDGSIYKENVVFSDLFTLSLQKEGYTGRLYCDADFLKPLTKDSKVKNGDTVYVKWTINSYTVMFMDGKTVLKTEKVKHGSAVTAPEVPKKDGKTFIKWDTDFSNVTSDLTINAVYDVDTFTVTFKDGEKVLEIQTVEYEAAATAPDTARLSPPEGMHFAEWDKDFSKVTEDIEVSAVYELNEYTVIFKNGETTITRKVKHGFAATPPNVVDTATKKFVGWDKSFDNVTSDLIVNAKFEKQKYTLTFIDHNDQEIHKKVLEWGAPVEEEYYTANGKVEENITGPFQYEGWYDQSDTEKTIIEDFSELTMPTHDLTYVLKLSLMDSAIGDFKVNTPADFTFSESNSAEFSVMPNEGTTLHAGVTYKYIWTINKDNVFYKTEETTESSLTLQNLAAGEYFAKVRIVASMETCDSVEKDFSADETLIVSRADISDITVTGVTMTYGDKTAKIGISGLLADDVVTYGTDGTTFPLQNVDLSALDCGEYDYFVRVYRGDNYNPYTSDKITVKINMATVTATVTPDDDKLTYGDNLPSLTAKIGEETYTIESGKYELHLGMTSITGNVANNVGTYNIGNVDISVLRAKYPEKNYNIALTTVGTIKINEAKLTVTVWLDKTELTYGAASPIISYKFEGFKLSDAESDFTITKTKFAEKLDVGTYTDTAPVKVSGDKTNFYNITVNEVSFKVNKRPATITINKVNDITYGDEVPDLSASVDGVLKGDSLSYTLNPNYEVGNKPGDYTASVEYDENAEANKNYEITATGTKFKVGEKKLTIKLNNTPTVAIGKTYTVNAEHLEKIGLVAGDTVTGYVTITKDAAGVYNKAADFDTTHLDVTNAGCYVISYEMSVEFVEVKFAIDFADVTLTYDGKPHGVLVTAKEGTNYTITYGESAENCNLEESPKYTNAGAYTIYFKVVDNDTLAEEKGSVTLTINKKAVEIKVKDVTITYGGTPKFEYTVSGLVEGETLLGEEFYSGAGTDAGEYVISVSGLSASNNYNVSCVSGKLTINKKTAEVDWTIAKNYVYSPDGQTLPTATYDGKTANLIFTKDGKACEFKNAGTYTVTIADDNNYDLTGSETTKTIVINKARYTAAPALSLSGTYAPDKTLGKYELSKDFTWVNPDEVPVCTKTEYDAKYNMDPANYEDFVTTVTLVLQKATVALAQNLFEFNFDGASYEISTTVKYNNIEVTEPYTLTFEKNMFSDAGTHKTTATLTADNFALSDNVVYVKVKGVKVGNTYYTIEDALDVAASGQTIFVLNDTAFATQEIAGVLYNDVKFKTVKTGVTLLLPFNENDTVGHIGAGKEGSDNYKATAALTGTAKLYRKLVIPEGIEVIVNGKLVVGAQTGTTAAGGVQNGVRGNYCEISLGGTITLNNATLEVYGYIKGNGEITANNTTVIENLCITGWLGGRESAGRYIGDGKILAFSTNVNNPVQFPFSRYELRSVQSSITLHKGSKLQGYAKIATSAIAGIKAQINEAWLPFASSDSNESSGLVRMKSSDAKVVKTFKGDRVGIETYGSVEDGYTSVTLEVVNMTISMTSEKVFFPICGKTDIVIKSGTFTQKYKYKLMPGSSLTIDNGATLNQNGSIVVYTGDFKDVTDTHYPSGLGDAIFTVNGTLNINGAFGGKVLSTTAGKVIVGAKATITNVYSPEGKGNVSNAMITSYTRLDETMTTKSLVFVNADNSTVAAATNKTYNYNNGTWQ